jgi:hypothetical protein
MRVETLIPWGGSDPHRIRLLGDVLGHHISPRLATGSVEPWIKALAVMPAVQESDADIIVLADADVTCRGIPEAIDAVGHGAPWAIPHLLVHRLDEHGLPYETYPGIEGGGILVAPRETLLEIPLDPRFVGWGQEDESHGVALHALAGKPWRGTEDLLHRYHPPQERMSRTRGSHESWVLRRRYLKARQDPDAMRALVQEAHDALESHLPRVRAVSGR